MRFGRVPKREKARILAAMQQSSTCRSAERAAALELEDEPRLAARVIRAHLDTCEFTRDRVTAMRARARDCPTYSVPTLVSTYSANIPYKKMKRILSLLSPFQMVHVCVFRRARARAHLYFVERMCNLLS